MAPPDIKVREWVRMRLCGLCVCVCVCSVCVVSPCGLCANLHVSSLFACTHVCEHMYAYACVWMHVHECVRMCARVRACVCASLRVHEYVRVCVRAYACECI